MTITEFLLARIAEDEVVAKRAAGSTAHRPGEWSWTGGGDVVGAVGRPVVYEDGPWTSVVECDGATGVHIARHDPARVLAECEAKRRIVEDALDFAEQYRIERTPTREGMRWAAMVAPTPTTRTTVTSGGRDAPDAQRFLTAPPFGTLSTDAQHTSPRGCRIPSGRTSR